MAANTDPRLQNQVIYSIYVRNHTSEGTFRAVIPDLDRIRALGTDMIWLMPIHPIGVEGKKGTLGCPYANRDYRAVNPAYGTMEDFEALVREIHARGMKCMIDVVYNHTSPDSVLYREHPEYFYRGPDGKPGNKLGDWADVIDLDYSNRGLWQYLTDTLVMWAKLVDGFRCDVASFVPVEFWLQARAAVSAVNPDCVWLAETVHRSYGCLARRHGVYSASDGEVFRAFDLEYEYDVREVFDRYLRGEVPLSRYLDALNFQETCYPANYNKLRFLENHDQPRIASRYQDPQILRNWNAFLFFQKGATLLYAGEERCDANQPSLFDKDPVRWDGPDISEELRRLIRMKKAYFPADGWFEAAADDGTGTVTATFGSAETELVGVFFLEGGVHGAAVPAEDGTYEDLLRGGTVTVLGGRIEGRGEPVIFRKK